MSGYRVGYAVIPGFYAAVERLEDPRLRARPVIVGGDPAKRGKVQSVSPEARASGVCIGMAMRDAERLCGDAVLVRTNMKRYREVSNLVQGALREGAQGLEPEGLSGGYFELEGPRQTDRAAVQALGEALIAKVHEATGLGLRVGVAPVKFLARLASDPEIVAQEDDALVVPTVVCVAADEVEGFLAPVSVERLPGVGHKSLRALRDLKIECVRDLRTSDPRRVERALGRHAGRILAYARGEDPSPIRPARHPKSVNLDYTFDRPAGDRTSVESQLATLCQDAESRLRHQQLQASRLMLKLRYADADKARTWSRKLVRPVFAAQELFAAGQNLLDRTEVGLRPVQLLGVSAAGLTPRVEEDRQLDLFGG